MAKIDIETVLKVVELYNSYTVKYSSEPFDSIAGYLIDDLRVIKANYEAMLEIKKTSNKLIEELNKNLPSELPNI